MMNNAEPIRKSRYMPWLEKVVRLLDAKYKLPGTSFRFGLDPIIGIVPGAGDALTMVISTGLVLVMVKEGASGKVAVKMLINVILDTLIGSIPIIGFFFDAAYKANSRNLRLLNEHYEEGKHQGSGWGLLMLLIILFLVVLAGMIILFALVIKWLVGLF